MRVLTCKTQLLRLGLQIKDDYIKKAHDNIIFRLTKHYKSILSCTNLYQIKPVLPKHLYMLQGESHVSPKQRSAPGANSL